MSGHGTKYTAHEDNVIRKLYELGFTDASIAATLTTQNPDSPRTYYSVRNRRRQLGLDHQRGNNGPRTDATAERRRTTPDKPYEPVDFGAGFGGQDVRERRGQPVRISAANGQIRSGSSLA